MQRYGGFCLVPNNPIGFSSKASDKKPIISQPTKMPPVLVRTGGTPSYIIHLPSYIIHLSIHDSSWLTNQACR